MDEFSLIRLLLAELGDAVHGPRVVIGPGDDGAVTTLPAGTELVSTIDSLVAGRHFPEGASSELIGCRAFGVAVSDLAAMGAEPAFCVVALTLPTANTDWVCGFARGIAAVARAHRCPIVGGNLARGALNITVSAHGHVPSGSALTRAGAAAGDVVAVSGTFGGATLALDHPRLLAAPTRSELAAIQPTDVNHADYPLRRYYLPEPRLRLGVALRGIATAAIDVSDGVLADLGHLCASSAVAAQIEAARLPHAPGCSVTRALSAGDDYELLFTLPPASLPELVRRAAVIGEQVTTIGRIHEGAGVTVSDASTAGRATGYQHFN